MKLRFDPSQPADQRYTFEFEGDAIHDARASECGRFPCDPSYYGLTEAQADELAALNDAEAARELANNFSVIIRESFSRSELREINERNKTNPPNICATHDFCDANMVMHEAWVQVFGGHEDGGLAIDCNNEKQCATWNRAWALAKAAQFKGISKGDDHA